MQQIEFITHKICPFAQRVMITLLEKNIDFKPVYVDLANKPQWFLELSPLGKLPLLRIGDQVLFESAIINEYLDEVYPPQLHPADPIARAQQRAWISFCDEVINITARLVFAEDEPRFAEQKRACELKFAQISPALMQKPFFNGSQLSLIDAAFAPVFIRLAELQKYVPKEVLPSQPPAVKDWSDRILGYPNVQRALPADFSPLFLEWTRRSKSFLNQNYLTR